jgi:hypothetical protein
MYQKLLLKSLSKKTKRAFISTLQGFERVIPKTAPGINTFLSKTSQNFFKPWHDVMMEGIQVTNQEREFIVAKPREWKP